MLSVREVGGGASPLERVSSHLSAENAKAQSCHTAQAEAQPRHSSSKSGLSPA